MPRTRSSSALPRPTGCSGRSPSGASGWRLHDARRTSRSLMNRAGVPSEIGERCLGHLVAGVEAIYNRYHFRDEMRLAFEKLAHLIDTIVNPQPNMVALHG